MLRSVKRGGISVRYTRYAIYVMPEPAPFAAAGAAWLGWDARRGQDVMQPPVPDIASLTARPRKYGFHATMKAPFRLATPYAEEDLSAELTTFCAERTPVSFEIDVARIGRFFALTPVKAAPDLDALAADVVRGLDKFRAPLTNQDRTRRRADQLSAPLRENLEQWGYPHVMEAFQFHITLTGPTKDERVLGDLRAYFNETMPKIFTIASLSLMGERPDGKFVECLKCEFGQK
jgi:2'-5' RNA ligase